MQFSLRAVCCTVSMHNGCDRYIAKTFQPKEDPAARPGQKQSGTARPASLFDWGVLFLPSCYGAKSDEAETVRFSRSRVVTRSDTPLYYTGAFLFLYFSAFRDG